MVNGSEVAARVKSNVSRVLSDGLLIRPGEGRRTALLFAQLFLSSAVFVLGRTVRDTLFLSRFTISALPWMFICYGVASSITVVIYTRLADKLPRDRTIIGWCGLGLASYLATWFLARAQASFIYPVFYVWAEVFANLLISQFWTLANDLHDARAAKRLFGTIGAARVLGVIVVGLGAGAVVRAIGTEQLLLVLGVLMVGIAAIAYLLGRDRKTSAPAKRGRGFERAPAPVTSDPYVRVLAAMLLFAFAALTIGDYQFKAVARQTYQEDALARFFSYFYAGTGIVSFLFQIFVTPRLLARYGVGMGMSVMPSVFGAASAILLGVPSLAVATAMKFADNGFQYTIHDTTLQSLYVPFGARVKVRTRTFLDAVVKPLSYGAGGALLLVFAARLGTIHLSIVSVALAVGWMAVIPVVKKRYGAKLESTLRAGGLASVEPHDVLEAQEKRALVAALEAPEPSVVLAAAEELGATHPEEVSRALSRLVTHPNDSVRVAAVTRLGPEAALTPRRDDDDVLRGALADQSPQVRAAAVRAYARVAQDDAVDPLRPLLDDPERVVRSAAVDGLVSFGGLEGALVAGERLSHLLQSSDARDRIDAAHALGAVGKSATRRLYGLLSDPDLSVRRAALMAARAIGDARFVPALLEAYRDPRTRHLASAALAAAGTACIAPLGALLADASTDRSLRLDIPRTLRGVHDVRAFEVLRARTQEVDPHVRLRIYSALSRLRETLRRPPERLEDLRVMVDREIAEAARITRGRAVLGDAARSPLFDDALHVAADRARKRVLRLLELRYEPAALRLVRERVDDPARRANALEVLDASLEPALRRVVLPLFDDVAAQAPVAADDDDREAFLAQCLGSPSPFMALAASDAIAIQPGLARLRETLLRREIDTLLGHVDPLAREAGLRAAYLVDRDTARARAERLAVSDADAVVRRFATHLLALLSNEAENAMHSTVEKLLVLRTVPMFEKLSSEDLAPLARVSEVERLDVGELVFEEGDPGDALYVVMRGEVSIRTGDRELARLGNGQPFGEMAVLDGTPRSAHAVALVPTELLRIGSEEFYEVLHEQVEIAEGVIRMLSRRLREANAQLSAGERE